MIEDIQDVMNKENITIMRKNMFTHSPKDAVRRLKVRILHVSNTSPDVAVGMSANGLVASGFASRYRLQPRAGF